MIFKTKGFAVASVLSSALFFTANTQASVVTGEEADPFESFNRTMFSFNEWLDEYIARPAAKGYQYVTPQVVDLGITNFFRNLGEVENTANNIFQLKFEGAGISVTRFAMNSTIGWFGFVDVATDAGIQVRDEDFGQTLGYWGVPNGPYLMLPVFGPSTVRDGAGRIVDTYTDPTAYSPIKDEVHEDTILAAKVVKVIDQRADLIGAEKVVFGEDKYAFVRDAYLQRREYQVTDGQVDDPFADSAQDWDDLPE
jgi:phospholipid-binding lipoprotein MlaA